MERNKIFAIAGLLAIAGVAMLQKDPLTDPNAQPTPAPAAGNAKPAGPPAPPAEIMKKLKIKDVKVGTGPAAEFGDVLKVHYTGKLTSGEVFDSSVGKDPFQLPLGAGQVIKGWDFGLKGMKKGGKRQLTIPPELAYGSEAKSSIPANSTLIFDVELVDIQKSK